MGLERSVVLSKLGKYEIRRELGRGAMGIVYEGLDPFIKRTVAIKTILKSTLDSMEAQSVLDRFRREAQAAGRLSHPGIVSIYEYGEDSDMAFIAMEMISGIELKEYFDKAARFEMRDAANIVMQLLEALEYSHSQGVIHRDIKPSNILITKDGKIKIADFGIAKIESSDLTQVGTILGTPSYMPPEQFMGQTADRRSDIYSAGVILYQLITGERPFTGSNMTVVMSKVLNQAPVRPSQLNSGVTNALDEVVIKAMSKRPEDRFQTAAAFRNALQLALDASESSGKMPDVEKTVKINPEKKDVRTSVENLDSILNFDLKDLDKRLDEERRKRLHGLDDQQLPEAKEKDAVITELLLDTSVAASVNPESALESSLLVGLEREVKEKAIIKQSVERDSREKARQVHVSLNEILRFFISFIQNVNKVQPEISRIYNFDDSARFANPKWMRATIDSRKQDLSESALLSYVVLSVNLNVQESVVAMTTVEQFDEFKMKLDKLRLKTQDDLEEISKHIAMQPRESGLLPLFLKKKPKPIEVRLTPDFIAQLTFQGNYQQGCIDVVGRNVEHLGATTYRLESADVTPKLLDDLGMFLIGRSGQFPSALRHVQ